MLTETLKEQTRKTHDDLESNFDFKTVTHSQNHYVAALICMYGFYKPVEGQFLEYELFFSQLGITIRDRLKLDLIIKDLKYFGLTDEDIDGIRLSENVPQLSDFNRAMGCLYVLEGSTLGGQVISKELMKSGIAAEGHGKAYYDPYGLQTMKMWNELKTALNKLPDEKESAVLETAQETFRLMGEWLHTSMKDVQ